MRTTSNCERCKFKSECDGGVVLHKDGNETISYKCDGPTMKKLGTFTNLPYVESTPDTIPAPITQIWDDTPVIPTPTKQSAVPDNVQCFRRIVAGLADLYARKNKNYGDSFGRSVEKYGLISALTRISDKFNRLENLILAQERAQVSDESLDDTLKDLAAYCIMTLVARKQQKEKETVLNAMDGLSTTASKATDTIVNLTEALNKWGDRKC